MTNKEPVEQWEIEQWLFESRKDWVRVLFRAEAAIRAIDKIVEGMKHDGDTAKKP